MAPSGSFFIRMHTVTSAGESEPSNEVRLHVGVPVAPSPPENLLGMVNGSSLALAWKNTFEGGPPSNTILDVTGSLTTSLSLGAAENFAFTGVPGGTYTLSVRAANAGGTSAASNAVTLTFPAPCSGAPEMPENFLAYRIGTTIFVLWDPPESGPAPTQYVVQRDRVLRRLLCNQRAESSAARLARGTYGLSVRATNPCGTSPLTPEQSVSSRDDASPLLRVARRHPRA